MRTRTFSMAACGLVAGLLPGCLTGGIYRTAKTLPPGQGDFGMTFSATRWQAPDETFVNDDGTTRTEKGKTLVIPSLLPELNYHIGVADNVEVGGRVGLGAMLIEADAKYRFYNQGGLHLAVQPALGFRALIIAEGMSATLPLIVTYQLNDRVAINVSPYASYTHFSAGSNDDFGGLAGTFVNYGGSAGIQLSGDTFYIMPAVDFSRSGMDLTADSETKALNQSFVVFGVTMGWRLGQEKQRLDRIEEKLDRALAN